MPDRKVHLRAPHDRLAAAGPLPIPRCGSAAHVPRLTFDAYRVTCRRCQRIILARAPQFDDG